MILDQEQQQPKGPKELFDTWDKELATIEDPEFFKDPREFRSLIKVLEVLNRSVDHSSIDVSNLQEKLKRVNDVVEKVVTFQHGGLNNSLDTMSEVVKEYSRGQEEIKSLRHALGETQKVLTAKKVGQTSLRDLWARKVELNESLKLVKELEDLKNVPSKVTRLIQQKRYFSSVTTLNKAMEKIFSEDLSNIGGLTPILQQIMELKERLLTETIDALKDSVLGIDGMDYFVITVDESEDDGLSDTRSESALSHLNGSTVHDDRSVVSFNKNAGDGLDGIDSPWTTDLQSFDETTEAAAIMDSNCSNNLYIRLLVKTIGALHCEDDAERLLFDRFSNRFCEYYLKDKRSHIKKQLGKLVFNKDDENGDLLQHGKMLGKYISYLLDGIIGIVRRFSYVIRLFSLSKASRGVELVGNGLFDLVHIWNEMEEMVNYELKMHLVESDVEQISDHMQSDQTHAGLILDEDSGSPLEEQSLFRPSSRHAAILFRRIVEYNNTSIIVVKDFFCGNIGGSGRPLLHYMQHFLESEFIPLIQSSVNQEIREMAINVESCFQQRKSSFSDIETSPPCFAASRTALVAESLLVYYQELFQHREMVMVVLDRLIRGFLSAAKDHMETTLFSWSFLNGLQLKTAINSVRADPLFLVFKHSFYGGKQTLEEALGLFSPERNTPVIENALVNIFVTELTTIWDEKVWEVGGAQYWKSTNLALSNERHVVETLSTILHGVEWLTRKLASIVRRANTTIQSKSSKSSSYREEGLRSGILSPLADMMKLVDEIVTVLRLACQVHCFSFVHELTQTTVNLERLRFPSKKDASGMDFSILSSDEAIILGFIQRLSNLVEVTSNIYSSIAIPSVVGPITVLVPRLLLNYVLRMAKPGDMCPPITTKLLRLIVVIQQNLSMFLQTILSGDLEARRKLIDCLTEECERLRRYIAKTDIHVAI